MQAETIVSWMVGGGGLLVSILVLARSIKRDRERQDANLEARVRELEYGHHPGSVEVLERLRRLEVATGRLEMAWDILADRLPRSLRRRESNKDDQ